MMSLKKWQHNGYKNRRFDPSKKTKTEEEKTARNPA
jgi:hypothetical protein